MLSIILETFKFLIKPANRQASIYCGTMTLKHQACPTSTVLSIKIPAHHFKFYWLANWNFHGKELEFAIVEKKLAQQEIIKDQAIGYFSGS
jgi:hypothetical protein